MQATTINVNQIAIKVAGQYLKKEIMTNLLDVEVDTSLYVPSMFVMRFQDDDLALVDDNLFDISKAVEIELPAGSAKVLTSIIIGEITSIEPEFTEGFTNTLTIRGYDKGHRLNRGTYTRVFQNVTDTDIVRKIATEAGLQVIADTTTPVHEHVFQHNQTNFAFLRERAFRNGFELIVSGDKLSFRNAGLGTELPLTWGHELRSFHPRVALSEQVNQVQVRGWDVSAKRGVVSSAKTSKMPPTIGMASPESLAAKFSTKTEYVEIHQPIANQAEADKMAQALIAEIDSGFIEAEGTTFGTAALVAGIKVKLSKLGKRFSGTYFVTSANHIYSSQSGYDTYFTIEGVRRRLTADLVGSNLDSSQAFSGVFSALVTNIKDPKNMGRVKLKFPWLDPDSESTWARISTVGGGNTRGIFWMPEINDEVLVAFEHGNFDQPYVIGGLYNGVDNPPAMTSQFAPSAAVETRIIQTKRHLITLTESPGKELIEMKDLSGVVLLRMTSKPQGKIEIECKSGDVSIEATNITAKASGRVNVSGMTIKVEATGELDLQASNLNINATQALTLKGATVNIN